MMAEINLEYIAKKRKEYGFSLQYMAEKLGFSNASTYFKYEKGDYEFKANMLPILSEMFKCDMNYFFKNKISKTETLEGRR